MARLYKNGTELGRWSHSAWSHQYVFMSNGRILKGCSGRYKWYRVNSTGDKVDQQMVTERLQNSGWTYSGHLIRNNLSYKELLAQLERYKNEA